MDMAAVSRRKLLLPRSQRCRYERRLPLESALAAPDQGIVHNLLLKVCPPRPLNRRPPMPDRRAAIETCAGRVRPAERACLIGRKRSGIDGGDERRRRSEVGHAGYEGMAGLHVIEGMRAIRSTRANVRILDRERLEEIATGSYVIPEREYGGV